MGRRGELFSTRQFTEDGKKTYFFNVKENRYGDLYINLAESVKKDNGFQRFSVMVFNEDLDLFKIEFNKISDIALHDGRESNEISPGSGKRKYKFIVKDGYKNATELVIIESLTKDDGYTNQSIRVKKEDLHSFISGVDNVIKFIEARSKK
ncbi:MAG: DUF3276 family protein [Spirochaetales bacterium]|nr:DUF3276 family protein [Spirochaetales bacterium]